MDATRETAKEQTSGTRRDIMSTNYCDCNLRTDGICNLCHRPLAASPQEPSATPSTLERLIGDVRELRGEATQGVVLVGVSILVSLEAALAALRPSEGPETGRPPAIERLIDEMRTIAMVAGQCSVEGPQDTKSAMAAAEAERASRWADALAALPAGPETRRQQVRLREVNTGDVRYILIDDGLHAPRCFVPEGVYEAEVDSWVSQLAGPETGDRERLRILARQLQSAKHWEWVNGFQNGDFGSADGHSVEDYDTCPHWACVLVRQAAPAASEGQK